MKLAWSPGWICLIAAVTANAKDIPFDQDLSFRATYKHVDPVADWEVLPFGRLENEFSALHIRTESGTNDDISCFVALSGGELFSARSRAESERDKLRLESPFHPWEKMRGPEDVTSSATMLIKSFTEDYSFFLLMKSNIVGVKLSKPHLSSTSCGAIEETTEILREKTLWYKPLAVTSSAQSIWVSTDFHGLQQVDIVEGTVFDIALEDTSVSTMMYIEDWKQLFVGTLSTLYTFDVTSTDANIIGDLRQSQQAVPAYHEWITGVIDAAPVQFAFDKTNNNLWLAQPGAVHKLDSVGRWWRYGYHQGAPMGNITSVTVTKNGYVWVGSEQGMSRFRNPDLSPAQDDTLEPGTSSGLTVTAVGSTGTPDAAADTEADAADASSELLSSDPWDWLYYAGQRYLTDNTVQTLLHAGDFEGTSSVVLAITAKGVALLETSQWLLSEKADAFAQFQYPRHDRNKLTADVSLKELGDVSSYQKKVGDNDGLWTAMHAIGEVYNYAATGQPEAKNVAWRAFEGLEMLFNVTGAYPHYPARTFCYIKDGDSGCGQQDGVDNWHRSNTVFGAMWKGDTSSDEIDGHLSVLPMIYDFIAETAEEKTRVLTLIDGLTGGIMKNDFYLVDPTTGEPTTWGFWNPKEVNLNPDHYSERGTNSLGMLAYLASAYSISRNRIYKEAFDDLVVNHGYARNTMNVKIDNPDDDNHSDNELITLTYHILFYSWYRVSEVHESEFKAEMWEMVAPMLPSVERTWALIGNEYSPLWTGIIAGVAQLHVSSVCVSNSVWSLRHWALDLITWPIDHGDRWDAAVLPDSFTVRDNDTPIIRPIRPPQERTSSHWNSDPFAVTAGSGYSEYEPAVWRLPYYMMLFYKLI